jgi:hypothetical protein
MIRSQFDPLISKELKAFFGQYNRLFFIFIIVAIELGRNSENRKWLSNLIDIFDRKLYQILKILKGLFRTYTIYKYDKKFLLVKRLVQNILFVYMKCSFLYFYESLIMFAIHKIRNMVRIFAFHC